MLLKYYFQNSTTAKKYLTVFQNIDYSYFIKISNEKKQL